MFDTYRPAWAEIDLDAIRYNAGILSQLVAPASLCAVVKADGYGHGAPSVAKAALAGGAIGLAVALVGEGIELREHGISSPTLLLSEPCGQGVEAAVAAGLTPTIYTSEGIAQFAKAARRLGRKVAVHLKVDTGMHRVGAFPEDVLNLVTMILEEPNLEFEGLWTHLSVAGGSSNEDVEFTRIQLQRFDRVVEILRDANVRPKVLHVANSAGAITLPEARYGLVRCGIALYGQSPSLEVTKSLELAQGSGIVSGSLRPALSLRAKVSALRELNAGERPSYGRRRALPQRSTVATVPIGYADGVPRALFDAGFKVLIGGKRYPLAGMVTMDQIMVDCGDNSQVCIGQEVTLLGRQGDDEITASEWAELLGTISYEVLCGIGPRVPRINYSVTQPAHEVSTAPPSKL